ncbi:MAG: hypothetical protein LBV69_06875, partial [Bacteroidales bacterium]|nr:hypothetical protein [Bacteroidales bacterium]
MNVFRPRVSKKTIIIICTILCVLATNIRAQILPNRNTFAQEKQKNLNKDMLTNEQFFNEAEFIIEVKSISNQFYSYDAKGAFNREDIYTINKIVVLNVYKGDMSLIKANDTIVLVKNRGTIYKKTPYGNKAIHSWGDYDRDNRADDYGLALYDYPSIIFCKKSDYPENPNSEENYSNYFKIKSLRDKERASLKIWGKITGLNGLSFNNREELFEYMQQFEGVSGQNYYDENDKYWKQKYAELEEFKKGYPKFEVSNDINTLPKLDSIFTSYFQKVQLYRQQWTFINDLLYNYPKTTERIKYNQDAKKLLQELIQEANDMKNDVQNKIIEAKKKINNNSKTSTNELWAYLLNQTACYDSSENKNFFHVDICIKGNNTDTFLRCFLYNMQFDGYILTITDSLISKGKVTTTLDSIFDIDTYNITMYDRISSISPRIRIGIADPLYLQPFNGFVQVTEDTIRIFHLKIEMVDVAIGYTRMKFFSNPNPTQMSNLSYSESENNQVPFFMYDSIHFIVPDYIDVNLHIHPEIYSDLSTISKHAGTGDILTINGRGFGNTRGAVQFSPVTKDSIVADGNTFLKGLDDQYYVSWTNEEIKIQVPSLVYDWYDLYESQPAKGAGTGPIKIKTTYNDSLISSTALNIDYSISNHKEGYDLIRRVYLARLSCDKDIKFTLHNNLSGIYNISARAAIEAVITKWRTATGIDIDIEKNSSGDYVYANYFADSLNVIGFDSSLPDYVEMETTPNFWVGSDGGAPPYQYYRGLGSHIKINNVNYNWDNSTNMSHNISANICGFYNVLLHEAGHILLLQHTNNYPELMYAVDSNQYSQPMINLDNQTNALAGVSGTKTESLNKIWAEYLPITTLGNSLASLSITSNPSNAVVCNGTPITLSVNNSFAANSYNWSNGATGQTISVSEAGVYSVVASNGLCSKTSAPFTVSASTLPTPI